MEEKKDVKKKSKHKDEEKDSMIEELTSKCKALEEEVLRAKADLINYRRRKDDETSNMLKYANADLINQILLVVDNFERALNVKGELDDEKKNFLSGFSMIYSSLNEILKANEVTEINCLHEKFDSKLENCLFTDSDSNYEDDVVLEVLQKGYMYKDKILRCASVKVNKLEKEEILEKEDDKNE